MAIDTIAGGSCKAGEVSGMNFDVTVIGAGPAGALSAGQLAQKGAHVLLVEKSVFPRHKVCGCCIGPAAAQMLDFAGLGGLLEAFDAQPLNQLQLACGMMRLSLPLQAAHSLSRRVLDTALVEAAVKAGARFASSCHARVGTTGLNGAEVFLSDHDNGHDSVKVSTKLILVADGIGGTSLQAHPEFAFDVRSSSRVGTGAISAHGSESYGPGSIYMACGRGGYLGLVRLEDGKTDIAAALDPQFIREAGNPTTAASRLLSECGWTVPADFSEMHWQGTVPLTRRRRRIAGTRVYAIGDAASYLEPFTGEGIGWALSSALSVIPLALRAMHCWDDSLIWRWEHTYAHLIKRRQRSTRLVTEFLRHSGLVSFAGNLFAAVPAAATTLTNTICAPWTAEELEWLRS